MQIDLQVRAIEGTETAGRWTYVLQVWALDGIETADGPTGMGRLRAWRQKDRRISMGI